jgi:hypothetical protein
MVAADDLGVLSAELASRHAWEIRKWLRLQRHAHAANALTGHPPSPCQRRDRAPNLTRNAASPDDAA